MIVLGAAAVVVVVLIALPWLLDVPPQRRELYYLALALLAVGALFATQAIVAGA